MLYRFSVSAFKPNNKALKSELQGGPGKINANAPCNQATAPTQYTTV